MKETFKKKTFKKKKSFNVLNIVYYGIIIISTLFLIIILLNLLGYKIDSKQLKYFSENATEPNVKIILCIILLVSYITIIYFPIKKLTDQKAISKQAPVGDKGSRGLRGKQGDEANCDCNDSLCSKKILAHITKVYNLYRKNSGLKEVESTFVIPNLYLKNKIKQQCKSDQFKKIQEKYGSHDTMGIYDYLFGLWTLWIIIILSFDKGEEFLNSETKYLSDFSYSNEERITINNIPTDLNTLKLNNISTDIFLTKTPKSLGDSGTETIENINNILTEFKKYDAWYWGSDPNSQPQFKIKKPSAKEIDPRCYSCSNMDICKAEFPQPPSIPQGTHGFGKIKIKSTNDYYNIWNSKAAKQNIKGGNFYNPFQKFGNKDISIIRPKSYVDNNEHPYFKNYKPISDVMINDGEPYPNTILVSGDIKPPNDYRAIFYTKRITGVNKNHSALTIWEPDAPDGYTCLGLIFDTRFYQGDRPTIKPSKDLIACIPSSITNISETYKLTWSNGNKNINDIESPNSIVLQNFELNLKNKKYNILKLQDSTQSSLTPNNNKLDESLICQKNKSLIKKTTNNNNIKQIENLDIKYNIDYIYDNDYNKKLKAQIQNNALGQHYNKFDYSSINDHYRNIRKNISTFYKDNK